MKVVSTKLSNPEWEELQTKCNEGGVTISEYLRSVIQEGRPADQPIQNESIVMKEKAKSEIDALFEEKYPELEDQSRSQVMSLETRLQGQSKAVSRLESQIKTIQEKLKQLETARTYQEKAQAKIKKPLFFMIDELRMHQQQE